MTGPTEGGPGAFLGVDIGGTFTDLVWHDPATGEVVLGKGPTNAGDVAAGVRDVVVASLSDQALRGTGHFLHATTIGLNAVLERRGATLGLLATLGFRDVLEIRRGDRGSLYDVLWRPSQPLVPRWRRLGVRERIRADGVVVTPLEPEDVLEALDVFRSADVECIAISFINAHVNPDHEERARDILVTAGFEGEIALSHEVSGEYREFERTATTVVDAYVRPVMARYLRVLDESLREQGFAGKTYVSRSGGGVSRLDDAASRPVETIMSGPAAGVVGAARLSNRLRLDAAIAADVGGTSFDTALILGGEIPLLHEGRIGDLPIQTPWIDVRSIGAGGGSIARVDAGGLLRVGPESAGAVPGPACYDRGGDKPTVTDAAAMLGMLGEGHLAGGMTVNLERARSVMVDLGEPFGFDAERTATGVLAIAVASMAGAIRTVTIGKGVDPRDGHLVAYGGAGPMLAVLLARELDIDSIIIPPNAGAFSATGLLSQDLTWHASRTAIAPLDAAGIETANRRLAALFDRLHPYEDGRGPDEENVRRVCTLDCRYLGQEYTLTVDVPSTEGQVIKDPALIHSLFVEAHRKAFGYELEDAVQIVSARATVTREFGRFDVNSHGPASAQDDTGMRQAEAWSFRTGRFEQFSVIDRGAISPSDKMRGPVIVLEPTATTYVDRGYGLRRGLGGELVISAELSS
jgi:N-methylhydantoinase A